MASAKELFNRLVPQRVQTDAKIKALSYAYQQTGMPKDQADLTARQQLQKNPNIQVPEQASMFGNLFTPTTLLIGGVIIVAIVGFTMFSGSKKRR